MFDGDTVAVIVTGDPYCDELEPTTRTTDVGDAALALITKPASTANVRIPMLNRSRIIKCGPPA